MRPFHVIIQRHEQSADGVVEPIELEGQTILASRLEPSQLSCPLSISFDEALERLDALPRMFTEPDGSFVWVGQDGSESWQMDGQLHDGATGLMDVEVKGTADRQSFSQLLDCFGSPSDLLVFQLVRDGVFLDQKQFTRWLWPTGEE